MASHNPLGLAAVLGAVFMFLVTVTINGLSAGAGVDIGLFLNNTGDISDVFITQVTPAGWTFSIWGIIYTWQALFLVYALSTLFRKKSGDYLYVSIDYLPPIIYLFYSLANCCNVIWLFLWDRQYVIAALPFIALNPFFNYIFLFIAFRRLYKCIPEMVKVGLSRDVWLTRFLVHNAVAMYATWVTIATLVNLTIVLAYRADVDVSTSSTIALSIATVEVLLWSSLDNTILDKYTRYTFSPYIVMVMAFSGIISKNFNTVTAKVNSIFTAVLLSVAILLLIIKFTVMLYRHFRRPITPQPESYNNI